MLERSREGARLRRRLVAGSALLLFFVGFAAALGFEELLLIAAAVLLAVGAVAGATQLRLSGAARTKDSVARAVGLGRRAVGRARSFRGVRVPDGVRRARLPGRPPPSITRRQALSLNAEGAQHRRRGRYQEAVEKHVEALAALRELGDRSGEALTLNNLALALAHLDDEAAIRHFEHALTILRELADEQHEGQVVANLALVHRRRGREQEATDCLRAALEKLDPQSREYRRVEEQLRRAS